MSALSSPPSLPVVAEDIRNLEGGTVHDRPLRSSRGLQWADYLAQDVGGYLGIKGRCFELLVPKQDLDHADVHLLLQQVSGETVSERVH